MMKTIKLSEIEKVFSSKKFKKATKDKWIYDYDWKMAFKSEKHRQEFLNSIKKAEEEIKRGEGTNFEDFKEEIQNWTY